jgi:hypothetical protein
MGRVIRPTAGQAASRLLMVLALLTACTAEAPSNGGGSDRTGTIPSDGDTLPLGSLSADLGSFPASCSSDRLCEIQFEVSCPDVQEDARGTFLVLLPSEPARGVVMFFLGGLGTGEGGEGINRLVAQGLARDGFEVVILRWIDSWLTSAPGEDIGVAKLGCRPSTAIRWTYNELYQRLDALDPGRGACGFCVTGNSGGASQAALALAFYGQASIVDAAILSSGPPHAALDEGCLGEPGFAFGPREATTIDLSYGFSSGGGPCLSGDASFTDRWRADSIDSGGRTYSYPQTRVEFIFGANDPSATPAHGRAFLDRLRQAGSPYLSEQTVGQMAHTLQISPTGRAALEQALRAGPVE